MISKITFLIFFLLAAFSNFQFIGTYQTLWGHECHEVLIDLNNIDTLVMTRLEEKTIIGNPNRRLLYPAEFGNTHFVAPYKIVCDNHAELVLNELDEDLARSISISNQYIIYPGTKWCGTGNIAANDSDLGPERETDKCCRTHDMCPDIIEKYQTKHGLKNPSFYSRLSCTCDNELHKCLKSVNTQAAKQVGIIYFTLLGTQCFKNEFPIAGCNNYAWFPLWKCVEYKLNNTLQKKHQWFDVPNF